MTEMAIYYDTTKCTACRACMAACKQWNSLPGVRNPKKADKKRFTGPGYQNPDNLSINTWLMMEFHTLLGNDRDAEGNWNFLRFACMHCTNAPCKAICDSLPYQAIERSPEGFIYVDPVKCQATACKALTVRGVKSMCQEGCPFGVPRIGKADTDGDGVKDKVIMRKCKGCFDRLPYGLEPACVKTCGPEALQYGDRSAMVSAALARAADADVLAKYPHANVYGLDGPWGGSHVIYVLSQPYSFYGLPDLT
jgi:formate dehydrogenase iron-sulfur subunit